MKMGLGIEIVMGLGMEMANREWRMRIVLGIRDEIENGNGNEYSNGIARGYPKRLAYSVSYRYLVILRAFNLRN